MKRLACVATVLMLLAPALAASQSLREVARRGGIPKGSVIIDMPSATVSEVYSRAELVIRGSIVGVKTRFTPDESAVVTEYTVAPVHVVKQSRAASTTTSPGRTRPLIVQCIGGIVVEGDVEYTTNVNIYPRSESFKPGEDVVLFLVYNDAQAVCQLAHGPYAAFRVVRGRVHPMTKGVAELRGDRPRPVGEFLGELGK